MALTPASWTRRWASSKPSVSPGRWPLRSFTVTGRPLPSTAARATATAVSGSLISAAPAPVLQTFGTGQPMFRSMIAAPRSATVSAALRMTSGSWPNSWIDTGPSSGWIRSSSFIVFSLRWWIAKLDTISLTASPAPWRRACRRTNQFPIPASGASRTRLGTSTGPILNGVFSTPFRVAALLRVALVQEPQAVQRQQVVHDVDLIAERDDVLGQAAGGDRLAVAELRPQPPQDRVHLAREAVDDPAADRVDRGLADQRARRREVDARELRGARVERLHRDLDTRRDDPAEVLAVGADRVIGERGPEVHDDARALDPVVGGHRVDEPVGPDLARVVVAQRHAGLDAGADDQRLVAQVAARHLLPLRRQLRHRARHDRARQVGEPDAAQLEQVAKRGAELVGSRVPDRGKAPVLDELSPVKRSEVRLSVPDVHGQQHRAGDYRRSRRRTLRSAVRGHRAGPPGRRSPSRQSARRAHRGTPRPAARRTRS